MTSRLVVSREFALSEKFVPLFSNFELNSLALFDPSNCLRKIYSVAGECTRGIFNEVLWKIGIGSFL